MSYTREQLQQAFGSISDPNDWRAPIHSRVPDESLDITMEAISYFTGTVAENKKLPDGGWEVSSVGYRNGPCGP